jgi:hypothetical protein
LARPSAGYVYFLVSNGRVKIGFTKSVTSRMSGITTSLPTKIDQVVAITANRLDEKRLHSRFASYRRAGEWFTLSRPISMTIIRSIMAGRLMHDGEQKEDESPNLIPENLGQC